MARSNSLESALKAVREKRNLRVGAVSETLPDVEGITTGNVMIDALTGVGGLPRGRIVELYGPPSSGKTTTALQTAARAQQRGENVLFLDYEFALDPEYCSALGLDINDPSFLYGMPDSFEQGMNAMQDLIATGEVSVAIVDSVAAMATESELTGEVKRTFQDKALLMAQVMRKLTGVVHGTSSLVIFLNHEQDVVDLSPMGQKLSSRGVKRTTTPGGKALKFHASVRLAYKQVGNIRTKVLNEITNETEDVPTQTKVEVSVAKNKVGPPFRKAEVRVRFGTGFSQAHAALQVLVAHGVIKKDSGGIYRLTEETAPEGWDLKEADFIKGEETMIAEIESRPEWEAFLAHWAAELIREHGFRGAKDREKERAANREAAMGSDEVDALLGDDE